MRTIILPALLLGSSAVCPGHDDEQELRGLVARANKISNLTVPGTPPFHLKLQAADSRNNHPEFNTEIELWWAAPNKWCREIKSSLFSQTALQNGTSYSESNSKDCLPWWLHQLITDTLDPLPREELQSIEPDMQGPASSRCAHWESLFSEGSEKSRFTTKSVSIGTAPWTTSFPAPPAAVFPTIKLFNPAVYPSRFRSRPTAPTAKCGTRESATFH